jgi:Fe-S cluster assembly protein SufD
MTTLPLLHDVELNLDEIPAVYALRQNARKTLLQTGFPTKKTEAWKYTDISPILNSNLKFENKEHHCSHDHCTCGCTQQEDTGFIEINFCHGQLHVEEYNTPKGLVITPLPIALFEGEYKKYLLNAVELENHPFAALNTAYLEQGVCILVEKNSKIEKPIMIRYNQSECENQQIHIHNLFILEQNTELEIVEEFNSKTDVCCLNNLVNEVYLKNNTKLHHYVKQTESTKTYHLALNAIKAYEGAVYKQYYYANGAKICRQENLINLMQPNASAEVYSAYRAKKDCLTDITTNINHLVAETISNQYAKAVLEDKSHAVFQGKIHIAPNAVKTSGNQLHKALYLDNDAVLDCKPELEIYADDVKCSHGASCGEIDKEQLFYLTSRGIDEPQALQILTEAHLEEIFALIPNAKIQELFHNEK